MKAAWSIGRNSPDDLRSLATTLEISRAAFASIEPSRGEVGNGDRHRLDIALRNVELNHRVCRMRGCGAGDESAQQEACDAPSAPLRCIEVGVEVGHGLELLMRRRS